MPRKPPRFTLRLCACSAFSAPTQAALEELFAGGPQDGLHALVMMRRQVSNSSQPAEVGFLFEDEDGFHVSSAFKAPAQVLSRGAAAAFHVSNDPQLDRISIPLWVSSNHQHSRVAITSHGSISWRPDYCHARRGDEDGYQQDLNSGMHFQGLINARGTRSAHQLIQDQAVLAPIASAVYAAQMAKLPKSRRTGHHRQADFDFAPEIRNSDRYNA